MQKENMINQSRPGRDCARVWGISSTRLRMSKFLLACVLAIPLAAYANYDEAAQAFQRKDYSNALRLFMNLSEAGDARATNALGVMYLQGLGVSKDEKKALGLYELAAAQGSVRAQINLAQIYSDSLYGAPVDAPRSRTLARKAASVNDPEGMFTLYQVALKHELGTLNPDGSTNRERYMALARRDVSNRATDVEAYRNLSLAAEAGFFPAISSVALLLSESVGPQNRTRALRLIQIAERVGAGQLPPQVARILIAVSRQLTYLNGLGSTHVTPKAFRDAQLIVGPIVLNVAGKLNDKNCELRVIQTRVTQPFQDAFFLPVTANLLQNAMLIRGTWQEEWEFDACGTKVNTPISFASDGLNGLTISTAGIPTIRQ